ncbi:MAG: hypothetical protein IIT63_14075 [Prevotella sp.]|nr:hypothetical protein [Prevotella sp.]
MNNIKDFTAFNGWKATFDDYLEKMEEEMKVFLEPLGLQLVLDDKYNFSGKPWLAVYEKSRNLIKDNVILLGINFPRIYSKMCELGIDEDNFNIEAQARITVGHEIGHGLVDFIKFSVRLDDARKYRNLHKVLICSKIREERIVEEFGESLFPEATSVYDSTLRKALDELIEMKSTENN